MSSILNLQGMHAATASSVGWIDAAGKGAACDFCEQPADFFKPIDRGPGGIPGRLWWCQPCETTWVTP